MEKSESKGTMMARSVTFTLFILVLGLMCIGRDQGRPLFTVAPTGMATASLYAKGCDEGTVLHFDRTTATELLLERPATLVLHIPGEIKITLDLHRTQNLSPNVTIINASGKGIATPELIHFRGHVRGDTASIAAITIGKDGVMGVIGLSEGDWVLGRLDGDRHGRHLFYRERSLLATNRMRCATSTTHEQESEHGLPGSPRSMRCVRVHWEAKYDLFTSMGGSAGASVYLQGLFNQMAALYANDGIDIVLSELFIWDRPDPYTGPNLETTLLQFHTLRTSFNADHAMLIGTGGQGGTAHFNSLCGEGVRAMAYSSIETSFENVPLYSWTVEILAHETGHVLGARHTHACVWNGSMTAIDGCGPANGFVEGICPDGPIPLPEVGGTIMSYCHLTDAGINFANGFGPQPAEVIRSSIDQAVCLTMCGEDCDPPFGLEVAWTSSSSALLTWRNSGASSFTVEWKPASTNTWTVVPSITDTTLQLNELVPGTAYDFRVFNLCGAQVSNPSLILQFTTIPPCLDVYEPNDALDQVVDIAFTSNTYGRIGSPPDIDYYRITVPQEGLLRITTGVDASQYEVALLNSTGVQLTTSVPMANSGYAWVDAYPVDGSVYILRLRSISGSYQPGDCYRLRTTLTIECAPPPPPSVGSISYNAALIGLPIAPEFPQFDIARKRVGTSAWQYLEDRSPPSAWLSPLTPDATYEVFLRARCSPIHEGYANSDAVQFSTVPDPCATWVLARPRAFLDGVYDGLSGLMSDSLRTQGLLPLEEPYLALGFDVLGERTTTAEVLGTIGPDAIVDWILVGIGSNANALRYGPALLQRDGDIVSVDGTSAIRACLPPGQLYYIGVKHRNHLGCKSVPLYFNPTSNTEPVPFDFTTDPEVCSSSSRNELNGTYTLWCGDVNMNGQVRYMGLDNDRERLLLLIGNTPSAVVAGYHREDVNLDGKVKYSGIRNDRDRILRTVGGATPDGQRSSY